MPPRRGSIDWKTITVGIGMLVMGFTLACTGSQAGRGSVSVAVWDLENLGVAVGADGGIGGILAAQIAAHFETVSGFRVVERQALLKVLEELNVGSSQLADGDTRLKLGAILGAEQMVFGAYQQVGENLRLDVRRVDVASGRIMRTSSALAAGVGGDALLDAADRAARGLVAP